MKREDVEALIYRVEHQLIGESTDVIWDLENTIEFAMNSAYNCGIVDYVRLLLHEVEKMECDCNENN